MPDGLSALLQILLCIAFPMAIIHVLYRLIDRKGKLTMKLTERFPFLKNHKYAVQIGGGVGFVLVFGIIGFAAGMSANVYFIVCGAVLGFLNGMATTIMYNE